MRQRILNRLKFYEQRPYSIGSRGGSPAHDDQVRIDLLRSILADADPVARVQSQALLEIANAYLQQSEVAA